MHGRRRLRYKGVSVNVIGLPVCDVLKEEGNIPKRIYLRSFDTRLDSDAPKNLLLIYDIPEGMKKERDWFRRQLKNFGFVMIQRSAWIGPAPLPRDFLEYVKRIGLEKGFKTFKLAKPYAGKA